METKSRYEVIAELEEKKAGLINGKANIGLKEAQLKRAVEIAEEETERFLVEKDAVLANLNDQLESIEKSLQRFEKLQSQKK